MIRAIVLAFVSLGALAQDELAPPEGFGTCRCLGKGFGAEQPNLGALKVECTYEWQNAEGTCLKTLPNATQFNIYPGDYGESCKSHMEPGASECFDLTSDPPSAKPISQQESWCNDPWCYVDPCACDVKATKSSYFPGAYTYSYATCGSRNNFLAESDLADSTTSVGDAVCKQDGTGSNSGGASNTEGGGGTTAAPTTSGPGMSADNAKSLTVGLGMVLVGVALV